MADLNPNSSAKQKIADIKGLLKHLQDELSVTETSIIYHTKNIDSEQARNEVTEQRI